MPTYTFDIEKAFPEGDPVARFVTVLAMIINDWHRTMAMMPTSSGEDPETRGIRLMLARQEAAACLEAAKFIAESRKRIPRIETFVEGLGPDAQNELALVAAAIDQGSPEYQEWLEQHRNVTSH